MRVYIKSVALVLVLFIVLLLLHGHLRSHGDGPTKGWNSESQRSVGGVAESKDGHRDMRTSGRRSRDEKKEVGYVRKKGTAGSLEKLSPSEGSEFSTAKPNDGKRPTAREAGQLPIVSTKATTGRENSGLTFGRENHVIDGQTQQMDIREVDPLSATEPMVIRQQEELEEQRFGFQPDRGRPRPPEKLNNASKTWLKDMEFPEWYTESVKRSKVYGRENEFVGGGPLYPGPCPDAEKVKKQYEREKIKTFRYIEPEKFISESKNPCWYADSKHKRQLRCLPYFYVAGVAKCGTTDLYRRIRIHPDVMKGELKEYHWWDRLRYGAGMELKFTKDSVRNDSPLPLSEYSRIIMGAEKDDLKADLAEKGQSVRICGDGSPSYLWDTSQWTVFEGNEGCTEPRIVAGSFIKYAYPQSKMLLIFRHPTQRLYSRFLSRIPRYPAFKGATPHMFHDFVVKGLALYKKCFKEHSIRECAYNKTLFDEAVIRILEGMYSVFVEDWLRIFTRDQIMFLRNEDYSEDVEGHMIKIFNFLDVAKLDKERMEPVVTHVTSNVGQFYDTVGPMLPETIEILNEFYKPFVLRLHQLLGDDRFLWKDIVVT